MTTTTKKATKPTLEEDLADVMKLCGYIHKDARNEFHQYSYASAEHLFSKIREELSTRQIVLEHCHDKSQVIVKPNGGVIVVTAGWFRRGEERLAFWGAGEGLDKGDKGTMKAATASLKYAMARSFMISWGDDPEADAETDKAVNTKPLAANMTEEILKVKQFANAIAACSEIEILDSIGKEIAAAGLSASARKGLGELFVAKKKDLAS